ncbi:MAG: molybdopterin-guanine dinucleotide biosynthesis protein B [Eubacteriales bacterium]
MKVFSVCGITGSGKTTTIERIITELRKRRYSVGSVKEIHFEQFAIDTDGTNTHRHKMAGSQLVTAKGYYETDILFQKSLSIKEIMKFYDHDYLILEGSSDVNVPKILTAHNTEEVNERMDHSVFLMSGILSNTLDTYLGIPCISAVEEVEAIVDIIEEKVCTILPNVPSACCGECGSSCEELLGSILRGEKRREDCGLDQQGISLTIDGQEIAMVPFVQKILENAVRGVVSELDGYREQGTIEIRMKP